MRIFLNSVICLSCCNYSESKHSFNSVQVYSSTSSRMRVFDASICALFLVILIKTVNGANVCGSNKTAENSVVLDKDSIVVIESSPTSNDKPPERMTCAWKVTAPPGYNVIFKVITDAWTEPCSVENVKIYDGIASSDKLLWEFCKTKPKKIRGSVSLFSSSENARIVLKTGNNPNATFFKALSIAVERPPQVCTNNVVYSLSASSSVANFSNPYYQSWVGYPLNASCGWKIQAPAGKIIKLQFKDTSVQCFDDSLLVYDGEDEKQEDLLKRLCKYTRGRKEAIYSYTRSLFVKFKTSSKLIRSSYKGFLAYYSAVPGGTTCSPSNSAEVNSRITLTASSGKLTSPGFPAVIPPVPITCIWRIKAPIGHVIKLDLETINVKFRVPSDYSHVVDLTIKSGPGPDAYEMRSYGFQDYVSETLVSDGRRLEVEYQQTDEVKNGKRPIGFGAEYEALPLATTGSCGANQAGTITLKGEAATFHSLNYPNRHPGSMRCTWSITVTVGQVIELRLDTSLGKSCDEQWIQIYDGPTKSSRVITKLCYLTSFNRPALYSSNNQLLVEFIGKTPSDGFHATYIARMAAPKPYACTGKSRKTINAMSGKLASRGFPLAYANNVYCRWVITVPFQHVVKITVKSLDLQPDPSCEKDTLRLIGDEEIGSSVLGKLCGKKNTTLSFKSAYNKVTVVFWSDATGRYPGFEASFEAEIDPSFGNCTKQYVNNIIPVSSPSGTIFTPRYPKYYPSNMRCTWLLAAAPKGQWIRLSFKEFNLRSCASSHIEIRDGVGASSKLIHKLCDNRFSPLVVFSSGSGLWVQFKSGLDRSTRRGFVAHYETIFQLPLSISCSEDVKIRKLENSPGSLASYEYPLKYQNNVQCTWVIKTSSSLRFRIKFDFLDIEPSSGCKDDYVVIRDGGYSYGDSLGQFCGNTKPDTLTSSEDGIWVQFVSNGTGRYAGFKLSYETTYNVRTIVLISVFSVMGVLGLLVVIGWIVRYCLSSDHGDGIGDESGMNMMDLNNADAT